MRDYCFRVNECTEKEIAELKDRIFDVDGWYTDFSEVLTDEDRKVIKNSASPEDIPFYLVEKMYDNFIFTDEDFWFNYE